MFQKGFSEGNSLDYLHKNRELFGDTITRTSNYLDIEEAIIEKDYYVTLLLKEIIERDPDVVFKGGTSLSKCFNIINRFSEDIDIGVSTDKATEGMRKRLKNCIVDSVNKLGFELDNKDGIKSRRDFNRYQIRYPITQSTNLIKPYLFVETAVFFKPYPFEEKTADSYIYRFLNENGYHKMIDEYKLEPFKVNVQTLQRTFIDKLFAVGDYYLYDNPFGHSRHLYDISKIMMKIDFNESLSQLFAEVRRIRALDKACPSASPEIDIKSLLTEICKSDYYKSDYDNVTKQLLYENVPYEEVKNTLIDIVEAINWDNI